MLSTSPRLCQSALVLFFSLSLRSTDLLFLILFDRSSYGTVYSYTKSFDRLSTRTAQPLQTIDRARFNPTSSDDPILQEYAEKNEAQVFATDDVLAVLMAAPRSAASWDVVVSREGNKVFLDKREGGVFGSFPAIHHSLVKQGVLTAFISIFADYISVNENAQDPPAETSETEPYNTAGSLSLEASFVNANFAAQVVSEGESSGKKKDRVALGGANPFYAPGPGDDPLASCGFRYRKFDISTDGDEEPVSVLVRTEVDAVIKPEKGQTGADQLVSVKTLLNGPLGSGGYAVDWQKKLDASRGAVAAMEMKNNSAKLGRWALQSILAGADLIKMGCVFLPSSVPACSKLAQ